MYTVGQFARICNVSAKALRHYDTIALLRPASVGAENQYRYYTREQVPVMQRILFLRELGLGLETIRAVLDSGALADPIRLTAILAERAAGLEGEIADRRLLLDRLQSVVTDLQNAGGVPIMSDPTVTIKEIAALPVISVRRRISTRQHGAMFAELCEKLRGEPAGPPITLYHDPEFDPESCDTEVAIPVTEGAEQVLPPVKVACATHIGPYEEEGKTYAALVAWVAEHGYSFTGPCRDVYLLGPGQGKPAAEYVTEIQIPIG